MAPLPLEQFQLEVEPPDIVLDAPIPMQDENLEMPTLVLILDGDLGSYCDDDSGEMDDDDSYPSNRLYNTDRHSTALGILSLGFFVICFLIGVISEMDNIEAILQIAVICIVIAIAIVSPILAYRDLRRQRCDPKQDIDLIKERSKEAKNNAKRERRSLQR